MVRDANNRSHRPAGLPQGWAGTYDEEHGKVGDRDMGLTSNPLTQFDDPPLIQYDDDIYGSSSQSEWTWETVTDTDGTPIGQVQLPAQPMPIVEPVMPDDDRPDPTADMIGPDGMPVRVTPDDATGMDSADSPELEPGSSAPIMPAATARTNPTDPWARDPHEDADITGLERASNGPSQADTDEITDTVYAEYGADADVTRVDYTPTGAIAIVREGGREHRMPVDIPSPGHGSFVPDGEGGWRPMGSTSRGHAPTGDDKGTKFDEQRMLMLAQSRINVNHSFAPVRVERKGDKVKLTVVDLDERKRRRVTIVDATDLPGIRDGEAWDYDQHGARIAQAPASEARRQRDESRRSRRRDQTGQTTQEPEAQSDGRRQSGRGADPRWTSTPRAYGGGRYYDDREMRRQRRFRTILAAIQLAGALGKAIGDTFRGTWKAIFS